MRIRAASFRLLLLIAGLGLAAPTLLAAQDDDPHPRARHPRGHCGDSCGGTLATVIAQLSRDRGGPRALQIVMQGPLLEFAPPAPACDSRIPLTSFMRNAYLRDPDAARDPRASPQLAADLSRLPPHFIVIGEFDALKPQSEAYAEKLRAAGVAAAIREFPGMIHNFTCMPGALDAARDGLEAIADCLRQAIG